MPVKAGVIRAGACTNQAGRRRDLHRRRVPGSGDHRRGAVAPWRFGRTFTPGAAPRGTPIRWGRTLFCLSGVGRICFKGRSRKC